MLRIYWTKKARIVFFIKVENSRRERIESFVAIFVRFRYNTIIRFVAFCATVSSSSLLGVEKPRRMSTSSTMDQYDESMKRQIASLMRVMTLVKSFKEDNTPCEIEEGLFLGSIGTATNKDALKSLNITHILTVASKLPPAHPRDFLYKIVEVIDKEDVNLKQYFDECFNFIDEAKRHGGGVLVHCFAGKSRSVTIVVAYLMKTHRMSLSDALQHVKSRRPLAAPNPGFMRQLEGFEKSLQVAN